MGCFSFICKETDKPALSTSFDGSPCWLFLLKDGKVIEEMYGNYDSYGRVFTNEMGEDNPYGLRKSFQWSKSWSDVCNHMFSNNNQNGVAVILDNNLTGKKPFIPTTRSEDDPNQGWGDEFDLMDKVVSGGFPKVKEPYHKVYWK